MENKANFGQRFLAFIIEGFITLIFYQIILMIFLPIKNPSLTLNFLFLWLSLMIIFNLLWTFINLFLISKLGGSVGKLLTGIQIISPAGEKISFWRAAFRNLIGYKVSTLPCWLGFIWIAIDKDKRSWHDQIADTFVKVKNQWQTILGLGVLILVIFLNIFLGSLNYQRIKGTVKIYKEFFNSKYLEEETPPLEIPELENNFDNYYYY